MHSSLHQAQAHDILRSWQSERNDVNHHRDFVLPMFIVNDDEAIEAIESMPGVFRYGCNSAINYLEPLVNRYGLAAVLLFPVVTHSDSQTLLRARDESSDDGAELSSSGGPSRSSSSSLSAAGSSRSSSASSLSNDDDDDDRKPAIIQERAPSAAGNSNGHNNSGSGKNNPFLNQNEETENLLGPDHQAEQHQRAHPLDEQQQHSVGSWIPVASQGTPTELHPPGQLLKVSKSYDVKLIKSLALSDEHNPVLRLVPKLRTKYPGLLIICDVCLCTFTSTGHCCLFEDHDRTKGSGAYAATNNSQPSRFPISNRLTCHYLAKLSVEYAKRGCDVVAPSDMMDGRIFTIREKLNEMGLDHVSVMSYSAKFASQLYGPFRQATDNAPEFGDRRAYQLPPGSRVLALKAVERDISEGADFVMVKPGGPYLDIIRDVKNDHPKVPIAVYQVSGEYAMIIMAAKAGLINLEQGINESLTAFRRAGATIIITYFTPDILRKLGPLRTI